MQRASPGTLLDSLVIDANGRNSVRRCRTLTDGERGALHRVNARIAGAVAAKREVRKRVHGGESAKDGPDRTEDLELSAKIGETESQASAPPPRASSETSYR